MAPKVVGTDIELTYALDDTIPRLVVGDAARLRQVLVNLLANAIKFTPAGEVGVTVSARRLEGSRREVHFAVRDTGIGIPKDRFDRLFKVFSQVDVSTTRRYGGTGFQQRQFPNSLLMPRPIPARSTWHQMAIAASSTWRASYSR